MLEVGLAAKGDFEGEAQRVIGVVESSHHIGIASGDLIEGLRAADRNSLSLGVGSSFGFALGCLGGDGESGAAHVSQYVAVGVVSPLEVDFEVDDCGPADGGRVNSGDSAVRGSSEVGGLVLSAGDAHSHSDSQQDSGDGVFQHLYLYLSDKEIINHLSTHILLFNMTHRPFLLSLCLLATIAICFEIHSESAELTMPRNSYPIRSGFI